MVRNTVLPLAAVLAALTWSGRAAAQEVPPVPVPVVAPPNAPPPPPPPGGWAPSTPAVNVPPPVPTPPPPTWQPPASPFLPPPPGVVQPAPPPDSPAGPPQGFFGTAEIGVVVPRLSNNLVAPVSVNGGAHLVAVPGAQLEWTGSPHLEVGYRLPDPAGAIVLGYTSVVSQGSATIGGFDPAGPAFLHSRLNVNLVDLDYVQTPFELAPCWSLSWRAGLRFAASYYDSRATGQVVQQQVSNNYIGGGPHVGIEGARALDVIPGLAVFGRLDGSVTFGSVNQNFSETQRLPDGTLVGGATNQSGGQTVPLIDFRTGLSYTPALKGRWARFSLGYEYQHWFGVGDLNSSQADLTIQGIFFRGEFTF